LLILPPNSPASKFQAGLLIDSTGGNTRVGLPTTQWYWETEKIGSEWVDESRIPAAACHYRLRRQHRPVQFCRRLPKHKVVSLHRQSEGEKSAKESSCSRAGETTGCFVYQFCIPSSSFALSGGPCPSTVAVGDSSGAAFGGPASVAAGSSAKSGAVAGPSDRIGWAYGPRMSCSDDFLVAAVFRTQKATHTYCNTKEVCQLCIVLLYLLVNYRAIYPRDEQNSERRIAQKMTRASGEVVPQ
jgi:hypothetical protein